MFRSMATVAIALVVSAPLFGAEDAEWKVGLASVKITPTQPIFLDGYAARKTPYEKVETDLFVKALVLEDRDGHRGVLVTSDLIGFQAAVAEPICIRLKEKLGLKREQILLNSSHIHTGPVLDLTPRPHDGMSDGDMQRTIAYTRDVQDRVVEAVTKASEKLTPSKLSWGTGVANFVMNRRVFTASGVNFGPNPRGLADRSVPVLRIDGADGKPRAVVFGAAVHNTTLRPKHNFVCGDYAGYAQASIAEQHPGVQAMFVLGCAGDADPYPHSSLELAREHGATLGKEVCRVLETKLDPVRGPLNVGLVQTELPLQEFPSKTELEKIAAQKGGYLPWVAREMLAARAKENVKVADAGDSSLKVGAVVTRGDFEAVEAKMKAEAKLPPLQVPLAAGKPGRQYRCPQAAWQFGKDLTLVGLSGEVVVDYVPLLEKQLGPTRLWIAGYCNDVYGYLPSARILAEGGYETRGLYHGGIGFFEPKTEEVVTGAVRKLVAELGRDVPASPKP